MANREKVIKGLECCILRGPDDHARCSQCSYESNCVNRLKMDALELLKAQEQGWISVKDRLPEEKQSEITLDFEYVLCATTFGDVRPYKFGTPIGWKEPHFWHGSGSMDEYVTHWMPLPEPPKEET